MQVARKERRSGIEMQRNEGNLVLDIDAVEDADNSVSEVLVHVGLSLQRHC